MEALLTLHETTGGKKKKKRKEKEKKKKEAKHKGYDLHCIPHRFVHATVVTMTHQQFVVTRCRQVRNCD